MPPFMNNNYTFEYFKELLETLPEKEKALLEEYIKTNQYEKIQEYVRKYVTTDTGSTADERG